MVGDVNAGLWALSITNSWEYPQEKWEMGRASSRGGVGRASSHKSKLSQQNSTPRWRDCGANQPCPPPRFQFLLNFLAKPRAILCSLGSTNLPVCSLALPSNHVLKFTAQRRELCLPGRKPLKRGIFGGSMTGLTPGFL